MQNYTATHPENSYRALPSNSPQKSTTNKCPESGYDSCLLASPPLAPQCAEVTNN